MFTANRTPLRQVPLSWNEIRDRATRFARDWQDAAYERGEAQSFWREFFGVFGQERNRVYSFEKRVEKLGGTAGYIDCFWPGVLATEHKSRGKDLDSALIQALDYLDHLKDREYPRYVLVSDFERIRLHDLETGSNQEIRTAELAQHIRLFGFIAGYKLQEIKPEDPVNLKAAEKMGRLHDRLKASGYDGHGLELLLVRLLFCLFADDTGIFQPAGSFQDWIDSRTGEDGSDLGSALAHFFQILNTAGEMRSSHLDEQLAAFPYVNGKLFEEALPIAEFDSAMREALLDACALDWSRISPAVFGALFQSIMDAKARRNLGAHYTSETNILKLIKPLFLDELHTEFEKIKHNRNRLFEFHKKLRSLTFLDPACGCGNFLVVAYRELRLLELDVLRAARTSDQLSLDVHGLLSVDVDQFYGIEIEEFPAQIAQVALWLTDHQMNLKVGEEFGTYFARIPLKTSPRIVNGNALRLDWETLIPRERLSYILGNPPFVGHHLQSPDQKADMLAALGDATATGVLDFVSGWYAKAAHLIEGTRIKVAYVSTNSITQGEQVGILWRALIKRTPLHIHFAHRTFRWSNEAKGNAAVYCVILGFAAYDAEQKLLFDYENPDSEPHQVPARQLNAYLVDAPWVLLENRRHSLCHMPEMMYGSKPTDGGHYLFTDAEKQQFLIDEPGAATFIKPFISAHEYLHNEKRWVLWLVGARPELLRALPKVMERVKAVESFRKASKAATTRTYPHHTLFRQVTQPDSDYVLIPAHTSENRAFIPFGFFDRDSIVGNSCFALPNASLFHFGVLHSTLHMAWVRYTCGRLKSDLRYSKDIVYNNFPWPVDATDKHHHAIETAAQAVLDTRADYPDASLADLYDPLTMPPTLLKAHQTLDRAVDAAYVPSGGKRSYASDAERVAFLFELYQRLTSLLPADKTAARRRRRPASPIPSRAD